MSSILSHTIIGTLLYARNNKISSFQGIFLCGFVAALAVSPDLDYIVLWLLDYRISPRYTHSIGFCLAVGLLACSLKKYFFSRLLKTVSYAVFLLAPLTHLGLDLLVGVHPMPLFWPISASLVTLPFGILPSAGRLDFSNIYLWRNLVIELGILLPICIYFIPYLKTRLFSISLFGRVLIPSIFLISVVLGISLER